MDGLERPYSIVSAPHEEEIELFLELVPAPDGNLTPLLHGLLEGTSVTLRPRAKGIFTLKDTYRDHLMVATVTGVVPYISMLRSYIHEGGSGHRFFVLVGASYMDEFTYDGELEQLAREHPGVVHFVPTVSRPDDERNAGQTGKKGWTGETGRVNDVLKRYVEKFGLESKDTLIYSCGHPGMIQDVKLQAAEMGFDFQEERFWKEDD